MYLWFGRFFNVFHVKKKLAAWQYTLGTAHKVMTTTSNLLLRKSHSIIETRTVNPCWADQNLKFVSCHSHLW